MLTTRKPLIIAAFSAAMGVGFVAGAMINGQSTAAQAVTVPVAPITMMKDKRKDIHLIIMAARRLHMAAKILARGEAEYGGHRVAALTATRQALEQCKAAAIFVKTHHPVHGG